MVICFFKLYIIADEGFIRLWDLLYVCNLFHEYSYKSDSVQILFFTVSTFVALHAFSH